MWKAKVINWITNIFGTVAGVPQLIEGYFYLQSGDVGMGIAKIAEGVGIFAIGYFTGKSTIALTPGQGVVPIVVLMLLCGFPLMGNAATYYASPTGGGAASCVDNGANVCTIIRAEAVATHGDTIIAACGTYANGASILDINVNVKVVTVEPFNRSCATIQSTNATAPVQLAPANNSNALYFGNFRVEPSGAASRGINISTTVGYDAVVIIDSATVLSGVNSAINDISLRGTTILQDVALEGNMGDQGMITGIDPATASVGNKQVYINGISGSLTATQAGNNYGLVLLRNTATPQNMFVYINRFNVNITASAGLGASAAVFAMSLTGITEGTDLRGQLTPLTVENSVMTLVAPATASDSSGIFVNSSSTLATAHKPLIRNNTIICTCPAARMIGIGDLSARSYVDNARVYNNTLVNTYYNGSATPHGIVFAQVYGGEIYNNYVEGGAVGIISSRGQGQYVYNNRLVGQYYAPLYAKGSGLGQEVLFENNDILVDNRYGAWFGGYGALSVATSTTNTVNVRFKNNKITFVNNLVAAKMVQVDTGQYAKFEGNQYSYQNAMTNPFTFIGTNYTFGSWKSTYESTMIGR